MGFSSEILGISWDTMVIYWDLPARKQRGKLGNLQSVPVKISGNINYHRRIFEGTLKVFQYRMVVFRHDSFGQWVRSLTASTMGWDLFLSIGSFLT